MTFLPVIPKKTQKDQTKKGLLADGYWTTPNVAEIDWGIWTVNPEVSEFLSTDQGRHELPKAAQRADSLRLYFREIARPQ